MKVSIPLTLAATALAGVVDAAIPSCAGGAYSSTTTILHNIVTSTTATATIRPTSTTTSTRTVTATSTQTNFKMVKTTKTSTSFITRLFPIVTTTTVTSTDTDDTVTITPDDVTSTISSIANFTPAASALTAATAAATTTTTSASTSASTTAAGVQKRAATGSLCSVNIFKATKTVTVTASVTKGAAVTQTNTVASTTTTTKTLALGGVTVINTVKVATTIVPTTKVMTSTVVVIPTFTAAANVVNFYQACVDSNLLNLTDVLASSDGSASTTTTAADSAATNSDPLVAFARPNRLDASSSNQVGINSIFPGSNMTIVASNSDNAGDCCAQCQQYTDCAGSYFSAWYGTCNLLIADSCADQSANAGLFYYDDDMQLTAGSGLSVSNGNCGQWSYGGANDSD